MSTNRTVAWVARHPFWLANLATGLFTAGSVALYVVAAPLVSGGDLDRARLWGLAVLGLLAAETALATGFVSVARGCCGRSVRRLWLLFVWSPFVCGAVVWLVLFAPLLFRTSEPGRLLHSDEFWATWLGCLRPLWLAALAGQALGWLVGGDLTRRRVRDGRWPSQPPEDRP